MDQDLDVYVHSGCSFSFDEIIQYSCRDIKGTCYLVLICPIK